MITPAADWSNDVGAVAQAREAGPGGSIEDPTRIRWGSIQEFKGLGASAMLFSDVALSKDHHRDLLYVGASRATDRLVVLEQR